MPEDLRPDPDELLARVQAEEAQAGRGKLKIFFGASAGVGKTYAMLSAARQQRKQGVDVVVGVVETHGRQETERLAVGLPRLPMKQVSYRDRTLPEFDLDAALARHPRLILVDELAHSNVAGSRHPKRWQDVEELLEAGIDVYTTVNVQHLETLNDVVSGITGIQVWETVPDRVFDEAEEVVLVDLPPDELLQRLKEGKVYLPHQAERAIRNFFRKGNLIALRELALRRTADRVDEEMQEYRREQAVAPVWQTREALLACIGPGDSNDRVVRAAARLAGQLDVPWHAVYVETPALQGLGAKAREHILQSLKLAQGLGAQTATLAHQDAVEGVVGYARDHNLARVLVGRDRPRRWRLWHRHFADRLGALATDVEVVQVARSEAGARPRPGPAAEAPAVGALRVQDYVKSALACALAALLATPLLGVFDLANIVMIFLLTVLGVAVFYGRGPAVLAAFLAVGLYDFFFVPPRFSFAVSDVQYLLTFAVMLAVGLTISQLTAGYKYQAHVAGRRERRVRALYEMSRDLAGALLPEQIVEICDRFLSSEFGAHAAILLTDAEDRLMGPVAVTGHAPAVDQGVAQWAFDHREAAGLGTDTLPGSPVLYLPLKAPMRIRGVLALEVRDPARLLIPEQRRLVDTFASLIAIALERVHYVDVAQATTVAMESERLRNSLLAAISHDLRTPLGALVGLADAMLLTRPPPTGDQREIAREMRDKALRMNALIDNLLDMARLQAGRVQLNRQWQPLEEVVGSALQAMETALEGRAVTVKLAEDLPLVHIDAVLMERVFSNLLENAAKYTPAGSPVEIGGVALEGVVEVWVADRGPGVPEGRREAVFQLFERGARESATPGVGLGLAICRAIVEAHGGRIRVEGRPGGGARFVFTLPRGTPPQVRLEDDELEAGAEPWREEEAR